MTEEQLLIKYVDDGKIYTTINRPTEIQAFKMLRYSARPSNFSIKIYELELELINRKHDPAIIINLIANKMHIPAKDVAKNLRKVSNYLEYITQMG